MNTPGFFRALFTEMDNQTWCPVRLFGIGFAIIGSAVYFGLSIWTVVVLKQPLDYGGISTGMVSIWGTVSVAVVFKYRSEKR